MVEFFSSIEKPGEPSPGNLLAADENIVIVDDSAESALLLAGVLATRHLPAVSTDSAESLRIILTEQNVALVVLDLELPGQNGNDILSELAEQYPDLGIIMVTGSDDLQTALTCLRHGADDYLTKPVNGDQFYHTILKILKKRRLAIDNRMFRRELELANLRTQFLHQLILKMNSAYLSTMELQRVLKAILIGITSEEGLAFNRAFLALFNEEGSLLQGELAIGPDSREEAGRIWEEIRNEGLNLLDLLERSTFDLKGNDSVVNRTVQTIQVPADHHDHPLIHACRSRSSITVTHGHASITIPHELIDLLDVDSFVITPLYSTGGELGVIISDNFVTNKPIDRLAVEALEIFAGQASLAIEHSHLYTDMQVKIDKLEMLTEELEQSRDLLIESERYAALGHMSAQLVHALRNPITSIGGTARLLNKRTPQDTDRKFLDILTRESVKVESTLDDLFSFVTDTRLDLQKQSLPDLVRRSVTVFSSQMKKQGIDDVIDLSPEELILDLDPEKIQQAFMHLIRNAIESMANGGTLTISCEIGKTTVCIVITDTGAGIEKDDLYRITDPFYTTKTYGTGMGLTLVEQILKQHNGSFSLRPNQDRGMSARVTLPLALP